MWNQPQLFVSHLRAQVLPELFVPVQNAHRDSPINKPACGGLWTAPYQHGSSAWVQFACTDELLMNPFDGFWWIVTPKPSARVFTIESYEHLVFLTKTYPDGPHINFEAAARAGLDGIALSAQGLVQTQDSTPNTDEWDVPSILWLRWAFTRCQRLS